MDKLKFYDIDGDYIRYLKTFDQQVPDIDYSKFNKFFCGIVLRMAEFDYFAPVTSLKKQQRIQQPAANLSRLSKCRDTILQSKCRGDL